MIRTNQELIDKFAKISEKESRSMSNMGEYLIKKYIEEYEAQQERTEKKANLKQERSSTSRTG